MVSAPQAAPISDDDLKRFRAPYLNRFQRVWDELQELPEPVRSDGLQEFLTEHYIRVLGGRW